MKGEFIFFEGIGKWVTTRTVDKYGNWKLYLYLNEKSLAKWEELQSSPKKVMTQLKSDQDGKYITLRRPQQKMMRGKVVGFAPPSVVDHNNMPLINELVGNGSRLTVKAVLYPFSAPTGNKGHALRLEAVRVEELVPYSPQRDMEGEELEPLSGMTKIKVKEEVDPGF